MHPQKSVPKVAEAEGEQTASEGLLAKDQAAWKEQAELEHMPRVEMVEWMMVEPVARKVTVGVSTTTPCFVHGVQSTIHKTCALAEEHQGNGRAEGGIMRLKAKTCTIPQESKVQPSEWPMAAKMACHMGCGMKLDEG